MINFNKYSQLAKKIYLVILLAPLAVFSNEYNRTQSLTSDGKFVSEEVKGVIMIDSPKVGNLLHLRGIAGKGLLTIVQSGTNNCLSSPIRLAAGDFGGSSIGIHSSGPIRLVIYSTEVANKLLSGGEIISEDFTVTESSDLHQGDIKIESGLSLSYGFVLNPGEWSWSSLFGQSHKKVSCESLLRG